METITVYVGSVVAMSSGRTQDNTREVKFQGEKLAERTEYGYLHPTEDGYSDRTGGLTDTRGMTETLYRAEGGLLIVQVKDWSQWDGEPTTYDVVEVTEADLSVGGRYEALGAEAGFGRPLTLEEVLGEAQDICRLVDMLGTTDTPEERKVLLDRILALGDPDGEPLEQFVWLAGRMTREQLGRVLAEMEAIAG